MNRRFVAFAAVLLVGACMPGHPSAGATPRFVDGAAGAGDPYFPTYGNGGYDVAGYDLALKYDPSANELDGTATITATATEDLKRFDLDLHGLSVRRVTVDGVVAVASTKDDELVITPAAGIPHGTAMTVVVAYGGKPSEIEDKALGGGGWLRTKDGAVALGQPESASTWFPVNDHPSDKATFKLAMTVPTGLQVISNGVPGAQQVADGWTTWHWTESAPMASYLSTVAIGRFRVSTSTHDGKPMVIAIPDSLPANGPAALSVDRTGEIVDFLTSQFGPYPFDAYGGIVINDDRIGYALETQTRPSYGEAFFGSGPDYTVVAHELTHQWFGDSVALERWQDIWLNEGFATYAEWLWQEHEGQETVAASFQQTYNSFNWQEPAGDPGVARLFGDGVYERGAMTVYALRRTIGDTAFAQLLKAWPSTYRNGNADTADLIALAEKLSGQDLKSFFQAWLYGTKKPAIS